MSVDLLTYILNNIHLQLIANLIGDTTENSEQHDHKS